MKSVNFLFLIFFVSIGLLIELIDRRKGNELIQYELKSNRFGADDKGPWKLLTN